MVTMQAMKDVYDHLTKQKVFFQTPTKTIVSERQTMVDVTDVHNMLALNAQLLKQLHKQTDAMIVGAIPFDSTKRAAIHVLDAYAVVQSEASNQIAYPKVTFDVESIASYPTKEQFEQMVAGAVETIQQQDLKKIVLARTLEIKASHVPYRSILHYLATHNSNGYTYAIPLENDELLLGASPELLVKKIGNRVIANPIAGSRKRTYDAEKDAQSEADLKHSVKDLHEHKIVVDMVRTTLAPFVKNLYVPDEPSILYTDSMIHLSTVVTGELVDVSISSLALANALHPTPAVCGQPREAAFEAIAAIEPFEREYFTGVVGYMDASGDGEWVVTIRCGKVHANGLTLYAGAGIVGSSVPAEEACETGAKFQTMLNAFDENILQKGAF